MAAGTYRGGALVDEEQGGGSPLQQKEMHVVPAASRVRNHEIEGGDEDVDDRSHGGRYDLRALQCPRGADKHQRRPTQLVGHCSRSRNFFSRHRRSVSHQGREIPKLQISVEQRRAQAAPSPEKGRKGRHRALTRTTAPAHHRQQKARAILFRRFCVVRACRTPSESGSASATDSPSPLSPSMLRAASFSKCSPSSAGDTMPSSSAPEPGRSPIPCDPPSQDRRPSADCRACRPQRD